MIAITFQEFKSNIKSLRSILIILILLGMTLGFAKLANTYKDFFNAFDLGNQIHLLGLIITVFIIGPFFVFGLNHDSINSEIESRTIRFLATKTNRKNIVVGKYLASILFWVFCLFVPLIIISFFTKTFLILTILSSLAYISYFAGLAIMISTIISRTIITNFIGVFLSIVMTILGILSTSYDTWYMRLYSYITPYHYYLQNNVSWTSFVPVIFSVLFLITSIIIIKKRDL